MFGDYEGQMTVMPTVIAASPKKRRRTLTRAKSATTTQTLANASSSNLTSGPISALHAEIVEHGPPNWASRILVMLQSSKYGGAALRSPRIGWIYISSAVVKYGRHEGGISHSYNVLHLR